MLLRTKLLLCFFAILLCSVRGKADTSQEERKDNGYYGYAINFGYEEFHQKIDNILLNIEDFINNRDSIKYETEIGGFITISDTAKRVYIKDIAAAQVICFMADIAGIELNHVYGYASTSNCTPTLSGLSELYDYYTKKSIPYRKIYPYWLIYNATDLLRYEAYMAPELIDIILYYDDNEDKYIEENPDNILSINFKLYRLALKQSKLIDNILNKSTILSKPDVKFNK